MQTTPSTSLSPTLLRAALNLSIPCLLASIFSLSIISEIKPLVVRLTHEDVLTPLLAIALLNGLLIGSLFAFLKMHLRRREKKGLRLLSSAPIRNEDIRAAWLVGFCCGALSIFLVVSGAGLLVLTGLTVWMVGVHIKRFARVAVEMLRPDRTPAWDEIGQMAHVYILLVTAFTLINASLDMTCEYLSTPRPFAFAHGPGGLIDALYFTVVLLTTVGFGDFHPLTALGKVFVTFECLTGYVIFALLIGIITGGVTNARSQNMPPEPPGKQPNDSPGNL